MQQRIVVKRIGGGGMVVFPGAEFSGPQEKFCIMDFLEKLLHTIKKGEIF